MNDEELRGFREKITVRLAELNQADALGASGQATVVLDQQALGRLSRMDALQNQAMAKAQAARRQGECTRLRAALARMDEGEYGYCEDGGEDIVRGRLSFDLAATRCISCANG